MDNLVWAEQQIRELKECVKKLEQELGIGYEDLEENEVDEIIERILEEFEVRKHRRK